MQRSFWLVAGLAFALLALTGCPDSGEEEGPAAPPEDPPWFGKVELRPMPVETFVPPTIRAATADRLVDVALGGPQVVRDEFVIMLRRGASEEQAVEDLRGAGLTVEVVGRIPSALVLQIEVPFEVPRQTLDRIRECRFVEAADFNTVFAPPPPRPSEPRAPGAVAAPPVLPDDPVFKDDDPANDWGLRALRAPQAWEITRGSREVVIAVVDSGVDVDHEELSGKVVSPWSVTAKEAGQDRPTIESKTGSHGTHVAVTAAGKAGNGKGTAGVAPGCSVMPVQVMYIVGDRTCGTLADMIAGLERARTAGADVINLSMGLNRGDEATRRFNDPATRAEMESSFARQRDGWLTVLDAELTKCKAQGILLVGSAGNDDVPTRFTPKAYSGKSICVGAASWISDGDYDRWESSNYDEFVTVAGPGHRIWSALPGNQYGWKNGTSMASPHVAGIAGLLKSIDRNIGADEAREIIVATAGVEIESDPAKPIGRMADAEAAVRELLRRRAMATPADPVPVEHQVQIYRVATSGMNPWGTPFEYYRFHPGDIIGFETDHGVFHAGSDLKVRTTHAVFPHGIGIELPSLSTEAVFPHPKAGRFTAAWTARIPNGIRPGRYVYVGSIELLDAAGNRLAVDQRSVAFEVYPQAPADQPMAYNPVRVPIPSPLPPAAVIVMRSLDGDAYRALLREFMEFMDEQGNGLTKFDRDMQRLNEKVGELARAGGGFAGFTPEQRRALRRDVDAIESRRTLLLREFRVSLRSRFGPLMGQSDGPDIQESVRDLLTGVLAMFDLAEEIGMLNRGFPDCPTDDAAGSLTLRIVSIQEQLIPFGESAERAYGRIQRYLE